MKCKKMTNVCLVQIVQLIDDILTKIFATLNFAQILKYFIIESAQLRIPASATLYDRALHLHMNLLINTHYHTWAKLAHNSQAVFKQILLEGMPVIFPELKTFRETIS